MVRVSNHRLCLPIFLCHRKVCIHQKGKSMLIQSNFKLKVLYSWDDRVVIKLPAALSRKVCEMCGKNNGDPQDDTLSPDGKQMVSSMTLARNFGVTSLASNTVCVTQSSGRQCAGILVVALKRDARWRRISRIVIPKFLGSALLSEPPIMRPLMARHSSSRGCVSYVLVGLSEDTQNLVGCQVLVQNGHLSDNLVSSIAVVTVKVYKKTISISREHAGKIMTDEQLVNLP
ncbi:uncharacterized protein LOC129133812 [Agelaius phoeniceus]|uniref:uncharacterized protein LOC129131962 n=1 Tax=Agelaius phoeniceus TaxID=39638 RepID=UPI0023EA8D4A|nr:uncharacterized protein LOC129131962 [Agelaius phoeniceus]XP_054506916.1 uncharacterized protein LOC129131962 [Agelaius phoeniceus]XP_054506917.1 uncharacterized protein LOC129131962 [Agelaius phoeniceus]XP_054506919.1 uncharacterized protein LOC129131962 [Agelaius phoeniceus]XP_054509452.1 uncharacterized protein LOC129133811 isoform X1 [Agelaius phoeniceus]XP_054509453.1 uncharacterized protein LOC129133811 isoform X1 [Agelaius phoeniceus]XP_054509454.1 uncharacterized protein LOC1291338